MRSLTKTAVGAALALTTSLTALPAAAQELSFISWMTGEPGYGDWWNEIVAEFEETHPGVTIKMSRVSRDEYADTMFTLFAGGNPPDIVHLAAFEFQPFANEGWLEPLDERFAQTDIPLDDWAGQATCEWEGQTVCMMLLYSGFIMAYNEKLLEEAGVEEVPTDYESFFRAAQKVTRDVDGDGVNDFLGTVMPTTGDASVMQEALGFVIDAGGSWTVDGEPAFDRPEVIQGLENWKRFFDEGVSPMEVSSADARQFFLEGRQAMTIDGPWITGVINSAAPEVKQHLKIAPSPLTPPLGGTSNVLAMPSELSDEKKDLVWDFIQLTASEKYQKRFSELGGSPAPRPGLDYSAIIAENPGFAIIQEATETAAAAGIDRLPKGLELENNEVVKIFFEQAQRMLVGGLDPAEAVKNLQEEVTRIVE